RGLNIFGVMVNGINRHIWRIRPALVLPPDKLRKSVSTYLSWVWKAVSVVMLPEGPGADGK
ncbi:MAG: hypothetical protein J2P16_12550, partial [Mycobacterium sp.]|nr:hypothetical protein [Mycobacterium sp.]